MKKSYFSGGGKRGITYNPETDNTALIGELSKSGVRISASPPKGQSIFVSLLINSFPVILLIAVWIYFMRQMQGVNWRWTRVFSTWRKALG